MKALFLILITGLTVGYNLNLKAENNLESDSLEVCKITSGFFEWYIKAIKGKQYTEFQPAFAQNQNGMATLDFTGYLENLRKYNFTDSLIIKEKQSYDACIDNLGKVQYADFKTNFVDLDDFEKAGCDFGNYYRWIGGQEPIDGIRIINVQLMSKNLALVTIGYFNFDSEKNKYYYWGNNIVVLILSLIHI